MVIINVHRENHFKQIIRELYESYPEVFVAALNWWEGLDRHDYFTDPGDHADEMETSAMMHLFPHLVLPLEEAGSGTSIPYKIKAVREVRRTTTRIWTRATLDTRFGR